MLAQVRDAIKDSEDEVNANAAKDLATVQAEFEAARAATKGRYDREIQRMADEVEAARKLKVAKMAHHDHTVKVMNGKQRVFDDKAQDLVERQEQQRVEGEFARDTHDVNTKAADTYLVQRNAQINSEADDDARYIKEERDAIQEVRDALAEINFTVLREAAQQYDAAQKSYITSCSVRPPRRMLNLLGGIELNVQDRSSSARGGSSQRTTRPTRPSTSTPTRWRCSTRSRTLRRLRRGRPARATSSRTPRRRSTAPTPPVAEEKSQNRKSAAEVKGAKKANNAGVTAQLNKSAAAAKSNEDAVEF